jgi:hypothetical protein
LVIALAWTALSLLLAGSWVLAVQIGRRLNSAPARMSHRDDRTTNRRGYKDSVN